MKNLILVLFLFFFKNIYSQTNLNDLGKKTYNEVLSSESISPCEITEKKTLTYCVEDGSKISYLFNNQILNSIITMTAFSSRYAAEKELENEISKTKRSLGIVPRISNGNTIFNTLESPIMVSFSVNFVNETYFLVHYIGKK